MKNSTKIKDHLHTWLKTYLFKHNLTKKEFCKKHDVNYQSFQQMSSRLERYHRKRESKSVRRVLDIIFERDKKIFGYTTFPKDYWNGIDLEDANDNDTTRPINLCRVCISQRERGMTSLCDYCGFDYPSFSSML